MGKGRKRTSVKKAAPFAALASCKTNDTFGMVYDSLMSHTSFKALPRPAQLMYVHCRVQAQSEIGLQTMYKHGEGEGVEDYMPGRDFVFPASHLKRYGYDSSHGRRLLNELIEAGFICKKESNRHRRKVNVYSFTDKWYAS